MGEILKLKVSMKKQKNKSGRPPFDREIKTISVAVFTDQLPVTAGEVRTAIDFWREANRRTFSETFKPIPPPREVED